MKKIIALVLLILVTTLLFGCTEEPIDVSNNPKEALASFIEKSNNLDDYYSEYVFEMSVMGQGVNSNIKTYIKGEKQKAIMQMKVGGGLTALMEMGFEMYIFNKENFVMCMDPSMILSMPTLMVGSSASLDPELLEQDICVIADETAMAGLNAYGSVPQNTEFLLDSNFLYIGKKTVAGKFNCHEYSFDLSYNEIIKLGGSEISSTYPYGSEGAVVKYSMCFEEKSGILAEASYTIELPSSSSLGGTYGNSGAYTSKLTLKDFRNGVSDSEFVPPTKIAMSTISPLNCSDGVVKLDVSLLEKTNSLNISVKESNANGKVLSKTISVNPVLFESQSIEVDFEEDLWNTNLVSICSGLSCMKGMCYSNNYSPFSGVSENQAKATWKSAEPFAIVDWAQTGSELTIVLKNNSAETLEFNKFYLTTMGELSESAELGEDYNNASKAIAPGATYTIKINTSSNCASGEKFSYTKSGISIDYNTANIDNKTQVALADIVGTC